MNNIPPKAYSQRRSKTDELLSEHEGIHVSKFGNEFDFLSDKWELSGSYSLNFRNIVMPSHDFEVGFRAAITRYAEEKSAPHTFNMYQKTKKYLEATGARSITAKGLSSFKSELRKEKEYELGAVKAFWLSWYDWEFPGIDKEAATFLEELILTGNEKGKAVKTRCPHTGPLTELEQSALLEWSTNAFYENKIDLTTFTHFACLMFTGRRNVQIRYLKFCDITISETTWGNNYDLRVPRAKQEDTGFRESFNPISITEDLYLLLKALMDQSLLALERHFGKKIPAHLIKELPVFIEWSRIYKFDDFRELKKSIYKTPEYFHISKKSADGLMQKLSRKSQAKSERTGDYIHLSSRRFRYTKATNLARRGISGVALAHALDQVDTQQIGVYTDNTPKNAEIINEIMADELAPLAQCFVGTLIDSERDALRAKDPHSRIKNNYAQSIGNCGAYSFCASGYRACYTCIKFQPWREAPHIEVLEELLAERNRQKEAGISESVIRATDRLLLAVKQVIQLCEKANAKAAKE